jgi:hypothetical protein
VSYKLQLVGIPAVVECGICAMVGFRFKVLRDYEEVNVGITEEVEAKCGENEVGLKPWFGQNPTSVTSYLPSIET